MLDNYSRYLMMSWDGGKGLILANINENKQWKYTCYDRSYEHKPGERSRAQHPPDVNTTSRDTEKKETMNSGK